MVRVQSRQPLSWLSASALAMWQEPWFVGKSRKMEKREKKRLVFFK
jgi:hypothetical protein